MLNHKCERKSTKQKDVFGNRKAKKNLIMYNFKIYYAKDVELRTLVF